MTPLATAGSQAPEQLKRRVEKYLVFRFAVILMALGLALIYQVGLEPDLQESAFRLLYTLIGAFVVLGIASLLVVARWGERPGFAALQVALDFAMGALLAGSTGGVVSVFCPVLFIALFNACTVVRLKGALLYASLATLVLALTTLGCALEYIPSGYQGARWLFKDNSSSFLSTYMIAVGIALHIVAILGSQLSTGLLRIQNLQTEILENMCEGLVAADREGRIVHMNSEARKLFGIGVEVRPLDRLVADVLDAPWLRPIVDACQRDGRWRAEITLSTPGGRELHLEARASTLADERGRFRCRVVLFSDLSLKREIEEAERRIRQLEQLYEMSLGIAHEIRNPLASIRGCVQEIGRVGGMAGKSKRLVEIVCRESDRLDHIIEEFMDYTRKSPQPCAALDPGVVCEEAVVLLRGHPKYDDRQIVFERGDGVGPIRGDRERLQQVILNLGLNALASTAPGRGRVRVSLRRSALFVAPGGDDRETRHGVELVVEDNGCGIPVAALDKIFTPFFTGRADGCGLGLSIVNRIVHDHGGTIRVHSREGEGTRFTVWLPGMPAQIEPAAATTARVESVCREEALEPTA